MSHVVAAGRHMLADPMLSSTLLAIQSPLMEGSYSIGAPLQVTWVTIGASASKFELRVDDTIVANVSGTMKASITLSQHGITAGTHTLYVTCEDCTTLFPLSRTAWDSEPLNSGVAAVASVVIHVEASDHS